MNSSLNNPAKALPAWRQKWRALAQREQVLVALGGALVLLALLWALALKPAFTTLRSAPAQLDQLDNQLQAMRSLAAEARTLRTMAPLTAEQAETALRAATDRLGPKARMNQQADRAVITFNEVGANALNEWLAEARSGARARPLEAQLVKGPNGFNGTVTMQMGGTR
jgi:general secretion pathway protein M